MGRKLPLQIKEGEGPSTGGGEWVSGCIWGQRLSPVNRSARDVGNAEQGKEERHVPVSPPPAACTTTSYHCLSGSPMGSPSWPSRHGPPHPFPNLFFVRLQRRWYNERTTCRTLEHTRKIQKGQLSEHNSRKDPERNKHYKDVPRMLWAEQHRSPPSPTAIAGAPAAWRRSRHTAYPDQESHPRVTAFLTKGVARLQTILDGPSLSDFSSND